MKLVKPTLGKTRPEVTWNVLRFGVNAKGALQRTQRNLSTPNLLDLPDGRVRAWVSEVILVSREDDHHSNHQCVPFRIGHMDEQVSMGNEIRNYAQQAQRMSQPDL